MLCYFTVPIFGEPVALPRGPHHLTREQVAGTQRQRLLDSVARVVGEQGFVRTTIAEIARRAGVSPNVFYGHFETKESCYLAAYDVFAQTLLQRIVDRIESAGEWQDFVSGAVEVYLGTLDAEPVVARAFLLEMDGAGPVARERRREAYAAFAAVLQERHLEMCRRNPMLQPLPALAYMGIVHGVRELACDGLEGGRVGGLGGMASDIERWLTVSLQAGDGLVGARA